MVSGMLLPACQGWGLKCGGGDVVGITSETFFAPVVFFRERWCLAGGLSLQGKGAR